MLHASQENIQIQIHPLLLIYAYLAWPTVSNAIVGPHVKNATNQPINGITQTINAIMFVMKVSIMMHKH